VITDAEIRQAAEEFVHRTNAPKEFRLAMDTAVKAVPTNDEHENEILGWRMATEAHLETIDRLRDEVRDLNTKILYLEMRLQDVKQPPQWRGIDKNSLPEDVQTRANLQRLRLFPDAKK
jgi:anti-sigma factor RsiW